MSTIILGGGIIGLSTAYYLSLSRTPSPSNSITIIDSASTLLLSASGYAGGFLASDWFSPPVASLGALSFDLHRKLAREHDGQRKWGYVGSTVYSLSVDERGVVGRKKGSRAGSGEGADWLEKGTSRAEIAPGRESGMEGTGVGAERHEIMNPDGTPAWITPQRGGTVEMIAGPDECAQVEPKELCEWLLKECEARGVSVRVGEKPEEVIRFNTGVTKLKTTSEQGEQTYEFKHLVFAAGAWTPKVFKTLFPKSRTSIPIDPLAGHSLLFKSPRYKVPFLNKSKTEFEAFREQQEMAYAIYCAPTSTYSYAPEAFARLARGGDTELWIGGLNNASMELPETADAVKLMTDRQSLDDLRRTTVQLTGRANEGDDLNEDDLETLREGLCFRPVSRSGVPIVTKLCGKDLGLAILPEDGGVFVSSGHGPWGISLSLGTGLVTSEMIEGKKTSADIRRLGLR